MSTVFIIITVVVLAAVAALVFFLGRSREKNRLTPLASLAFGFVLAGIVFGEQRWIGYGLMGLGVLLALVDLYLRSRSA